MSPGPAVGKYYEAMEGRRHRIFMRRFYFVLPVCAWLIVAVQVLFFFPAASYWMWQIGASLAIDAIVYVILPLLLIGFLISLVRNFRAVLAELWWILSEVRNFFR